MLQHHRTLSLRPISYLPNRYYNPIWKRQNQMNLGFSSSLLHFHGMVLVWNHRLFRKTPPMRLFIYFQQRPKMALRALYVVKCSQILWNTLKAPTEISEAKKVWNGRNFRLVSYQFETRGKNIRVTRMCKIITRIRISRAFLPPVSHDKSAWN